jgi:integrase
MADDLRGAVMQNQPTGQADVAGRGKSPAPKKRDDRKLKKTAVPGIYKKGNGYIVIYRADGKQRKESAPTMEAARRIKRSRETDSDRGEFQEQSRETLHAYAAEWIKRYHGNGRRGFREGSRNEYWRLLNKFALKYFKPSLRMTDITPRHLAEFVGWLADDEQQSKHLSDKTIGNATIPLRALLSTAVREGVLRNNPAFGLALPHRDDNEIDEDDEDEIRVFTREQLKQLLRIVDIDRYILFMLLASSGLRISEAVGVRWRDLYLDTDRPYLRVRRAIVHGRLEPPKTKHGRRKVPLSTTMVLLFKFQRACSPDAQDEDLVFLSKAGTAIDTDNLRNRVLKPAVRAVGADWAGFHAFRHTFASLQIANGANLLQLSRALGHHSPAFTLAVYGHLLTNEEAPALDLERELAPRGGPERPRAA